MNKKALSFILVVFMLFSFVSCTGAGTDDEDQIINIYFKDYKDKDYIRKLLEEYPSDSGVKINVDFKEKEEVDYNAIVTPGTIEDGQPFDIKGYGFAVDSQVIVDLVGDDKADNFIADVKNSTYEEWVHLIFALDDYIAGNTSISVSFGNNTYEFSKSKTTLLSKLNGVFATAGGDKKYYGDRLLNVAFKSVSFGAIENAKTTSEAIEMLNPPLVDYVKALDIITARIAGRYSAGMRGNDFPTRYYGPESTRNIFMKDNAVFLIADSSEYDSLSSINANKAEKLVLLPVKMPSKAIDTIPANIDYSIEIFEDENKNEVEEFYKWYLKQENPLEKSVLSYIESGDTLRYEIDSEAYDDWREIILADEGVKRFLAISYWGDFGQNQIVEFMIDSWFKE